MQKSLIKAVVGIVFNEQEQVLLSTRAQGRSYEGYWEFPGGKVEAGESERIALSRELSEELNIEIKQATPWLKKIVTSSIEILELSFWRIMSTEWSGQIRANEEQQWEWTDLDKLEQKKLLPTNLGLVRELRLPAVLFLNGNFFTDEREIFRIYSIKEASRKEQAQYAFYQEILELNHFPKAKWLAVIVENQREARESLDANALIWNLTTESSFRELVSWLRKGQFLPTFALHASPQEAHMLTTLGIHGFIKEITRALG
ncbi:MAG: NUDIX domain-containing protein [Neisseriaceae bacterium]